MGLLPLKMNKRATLLLNLSNTSQVYGKQTRQSKLHEMPDFMLHKAQLGNALSNQVKQPLPMKGC